MVALEFSDTCVKNLLFAFNFLFFFIGLALIIIGTIIEVAFKDYFGIIGNEVNSVAVLLIFVGCIIFVVGLFGWVGALKENHCMVLTFAILMAVIFVLEITTGIIAFHSQGTLEVVVEKGMEDARDRYPISNATQIAFDALQSRLQCCGIRDGPKDWEKVAEDLKLKYPKSCCLPGQEDSSSCGQSTNVAHSNGCLPVLKVYLETEVLWIGGIGVAVALIQIIGIVFAFYLASHLHSGYLSV